ncbi:unnamed protein product [Cylicocyclus nassatus]|uniref:G-protein coupled receptors family 1 profile domain-containing protein n=1 Tax=Cylicocyclus nassatus TaxID=53992 RepID=A0AA36MEC9_CYLNA|nr:unnamed protein product [Cylicocyclus nassatus]
MPTNDSHDADGMHYEPSDLIVTVVFSCYVLYTAAIVIGIPCNAFVLYRMCRLSKKCSDMYSNGVGLCLFFMAVADIGSLLSILVHYILSIHTETQLAADYIGVEGVNAVCKIATFSMHISTFVSIWSWLLMSTLRYLSVYKPLFYIRLWKLPVKVMCVVVCVAVLCNAWLLVSVENDPSGGCTTRSLFNSQLVNKIFLLIEIVCSFVIPTLTIVYVDASVLFGLYFRMDVTKPQEPDLRRNFSPRSQRNSSYLWRWLIIALIDVGLNAPENLSRLALILGIIKYSESEMFYIYRIVAQVPYYLQFGFNGVYLALFIYDKSTRPARRRVFGSVSMDTHHLSERQREAQGLVGQDQSLCDSGIEDEPCRV